MAAALALAMSWPGTALARMAGGLEELASGNAPLLWLQGQACSGCSISFLDSVYPDPATVLTKYVSLAFHPVISAATGDLAMATIQQVASAGQEILVIEGAIPQAMPEACRVGDQAFADLVATAARSAGKIVALGTCASFGGIPCAAPNPTGAVTVGQFLAGAGITTPVINLPGCPAHPDWLVGTLLHLLGSVDLKLDDQGRPELFYGSVIHARCPHYYEYEQEAFAQKFGDEGCMFKLGCLGIRTNADCPTRRWNGKTSWCVEAGAPCIGCARPEFVRDAGFPLFRIDEAAD
jgi:hydrogenase small subunit